MIALLPVITAACSMLLASPSPPRAMPPNHPPTPPPPPTAPAHPPGAPPGGAFAPAMPEQALAEFMRSGIRGTLAVRAVQGTKGGPEVKGDEVEITLFHRNQPIKQIKTVLDEHGVAMVSDLPVAMGVRPLVRVKHSGIYYQEAGPPLDAQKREAAMDVTVYETTDERPDWKIVARHAATGRIDGVQALQVGETIIVENPADRTWLGEPPTADGRRTTVTATIPADATDIELGPGFHGWCCTSFGEDGTIRIQMPLMPGRMTYQFGYFVPETEGRSELRLVNPVAADSVAVLIANDGSSVEAQQMNPDGVDTRGPQPMRVFKAQALAAGQTAGVRIVRLIAAAPTPAPAASRAADPTRFVLWGVGVVAAVIAIAVVLRKARAAVVGGGKAS